MKAFLIYSGRKNYKDQYKRILNNLLLAQAYNSTMRNKFDILLFDVKSIKILLSKLKVDTGVIGAAAIFR